MVSNDSIFTTMYAACHVFNMGWSLYCEGYLDSLDMPTCLLTKEQAEKQLKSKYCKSNYCKNLILDKFEEE